MKRTGTVVSWTQLHAPPTGFAAGRMVVLVTLQGRALLAEWSGGKPPTLGQTVQVVAGQPPRAHPTL